MLITQQFAKSITATGNAGLYRYELVDATSGAITRTVPAVAGNKFKTLSFIKVDSGANAVTIEGSGSETINGALNQALTTQYEGVTITCDGAAWYIVS